jgi:hypothetical protein
MSIKNAKKPTGADAPTPWPEQLGQVAHPTPSYSATVLDRALNSVRDLNQHLQELQVSCGIKVNVDGSEQALLQSHHWPVHTGR